jgi:twinkle protein
MSTHGNVIDRAQCPGCADKGGDTSTDNLAVYESGYKKCFACDYYSYDAHSDEKVVRVKKITPLIDTLTYKDLNSRKLNENTCRHFDYALAKHYDTPCQVASYKDTNGKVIAQKIRFADKKFIWTGDNSKVGFYGQHLYASGKKLVVTEGEIDALSVSQAIGNKWPVVSVPNGSQSAAKTFKDNIDYLGNFEEIILFFDADDAGRAAVNEIAKLFPGKIKTAMYPAGIKDANELLVAGKADKIKEIYWSAGEAGVFDDIIDMADLTFEEIIEQPVIGYELPFTELSEAMKGLRKAELTIITAGSGIGKSTIVAEMAYKLALDDGLRIGNIFLEESHKKTAQRYIALDNNINLGELRKNPELLTREQFEVSKEKLFVKTGMLTMSHFGSMECDKLIRKLEFLAVGRDCDFIILDHISMVVSGLDSVDERKDIDKLMTSLRSFIERTGVGVVAIVHLKRPPQGKSFNQGREVALSDLRGSAGLEQLTDNVVAAERNQQDPGNKHVINFRILKCREFGDATGLAGSATFNPDTGRLVNGMSPTFKAPKPNTNQYTNEEIF